MNWEAKTELLLGLMVFFRSARKISRYLAGFKLHPLERAVESRQRKKCRCEVCSKVKIDNFSSNVVGETYQKKQWMNFSSNYKQLQ